MRKLYLIQRRYLTAILMCLAIAGYAQQRTVTGRVTSSDDKMALPGVNILEKGTSNGTVTDANGEFKIETSANATLSFSFVGYQTQDVTVGDQTTINVTLVTDVAALSEVVVVGYGQQ